MNGYVNCNRHVLNVAQAKTYCISTQTQHEMFLLSLFVDVHVLAIFFLLPAISIKLAKLQKHDEKRA